MLIRVSAAARMTVVFVFTFQRWAAFSAASSGLESIGAVSTGSDDVETS